MFMAVNPLGRKLPFDVYRLKCGQTKSSISDVNSDHVYVIAIVTRMCHFGYFGTLTAAVITVRGTYHGRGPQWLWRVRMPGRRGLRVGQLTRVLAGPDLRSG
jgi:hypothetical protein